MNSELVHEFDAATQALDALAAAATEARSSIEQRLARDIADLRMHGLDDSWQTRWIQRPLRAIRMLEGLRLKLMVELDEVRQEIRDVDAHLSLLREAGRTADADFAGRKAVRLLCHEADLKERLDAPVANRITSARNGIARVLEVSLRQAGREAIRVARESAEPGADPALAKEAFARAEAYNKQVAEAHRVTGGVDVPVFLPDHVARLRGAQAALAEDEARTNLSAPSSRPAAPPPGARIASKSVPRSPSAARPTSRVAATAAPSPRTEKAAVPPRLRVIAGA